MKQYSILLTYSSMCWNFSRKNHWTSKAVRSSFIDFFKQEDHKYIRSSPVLPWKDQSIPFVNAGMIQFKPVLLGQRQPIYSRVVNSQKCVRLGGKHNDLLAVGKDTYHHTFFEMLGNWSFGDYFKMKSCTLAWTLMTEVFRLPSNRLYVTYFGGDVALNLPPDEEMLHVWLSLGIPRSHILPFGVEDNFWEMGPVGPCGPCTEIHYDRVGRPDAAQQVNKGIDDVIELWNIVFIQYERFRDSTLGPLDMHSVDTGMGLERITAALNGYKSNYDSDLFTPLFNTIQKLSKKPSYSGKFGGCERDTGYRILADHCRLLAVTLADGIVAADCPKWKRILHRTLTLGEEQFGLASSTWLEEMMVTVAEGLGDVYPELWGKLRHSTEVLREEVEIIKMEQATVIKQWDDIVKHYPALKYFEKDRSKVLNNTINIMLKKAPEWHKADGIIPMSDAVDIILQNQNDVSLLEELAVALNLKVNTLDLEMALQNAINSTKLETQELLKTQEQNDMKKTILQSLISGGIPQTDNTSKYSYYIDNMGNYTYNTHCTEIVRMFSNDYNELNTANSGDYVGLVMKSSNFYFESGGQLGDTGIIKHSGVSINIDHVDEIEGHLIHWGVVSTGRVNIGEAVDCNINTERRINCSRHHTAIHLLNNAIKTKNIAVSQVSSLAAPEFFEVTVHINKKLSSHDVLDIEKIIQGWIKSEQPINRRIVELDEALEQDVSFLPGFVYPPTVSLVTVKDDVYIDEPISHSNSTENTSSLLNSNELCCGTHLLNTSHAHNIIITSFKQKGSKLVTFKGICGPRVDEILDLQSKMIEELPYIEQLTGQTSFDYKKYDGLIEKVERYSQVPMSYSIKEQFGSKISIILRKLHKNKNDIIHRQQIQFAMDKSTDGIIIELFYSDNKKLEIERLSRICKTHATLLLDLNNDEQLYGRIVIPKELVRQGYSASIWAGIIANLFDGYKGKERTRAESCDFVCKKTVNKIELDKLMPEIRKMSSKYFDTSLKDKQLIF